MLAPRLNYTCPRCRSEFTYIGRGVPAQCIWCDEDDGRRRRILAAQRASACSARGQKARRHSMRPNGRKAGR
jgi:hypothetical protein